MSSSWLAYRALTLAFLQSLWNNKSRLLVLVAVIVFAVVALLQAPQRLSTLSQRSVKVAAVDGTPAALSEALARGPRVRLTRVDTLQSALADLAVGRADAVVAPRPDGRPGIEVRSAGIFGEVASKTVASIAYREALGDDGPPVVEVREPFNGQLLGLLLPNLLTVELLGAALGLAQTALGGLRASGMLIRLRSTGITAVPLLAAITTANLVVSAAAIGVLLLAARSVVDTSAQPLGLVATALLGYAMLSSLGLLLASRFRNAQNAANFFVYLAPFLVLPAAVPVPNITSRTGQLVVTSTPTGALVEAFRSALGGADAQPLGLPLVIVLAWTALALLLAARLFRWENVRG